MKKTTTPCSFLQGSSARKRRYSSTAVGFPIRNDQKSHSQRVSKGFPSWVGARCAYTYVQAHDNCVHSHSNRLNKSITEAHIRLAFDAFTPNERQKNCPRKPTQRPTMHHSATHHQPTMHHSATHEAPLNDSPPAHEAPLNDSPPAHEAPLNDSPPAHEAPLSDSPPAHDAPPNDPYSTHEAVLVRLRLTYGSLGSHLTQLKTHPAPVHHTFRAKSQTYPGSFTIH